MGSGWSRFNNYLYKYWKLETVVILLGLVGVPLALVNPLLAKFLVDGAYGNRDLRLFLILAVIGGGVFILSALMNSLSNYLSTRIKCRVNFDMMKDIFRHFQRLPIGFFKQRGTGEQVYSISEDVSSVSDFLCDSAPQVVTLFPRFLLILAIVFGLSRPNWKLPLLAIALVPITCVNPYFFRKWLTEVCRRAVEKYERIFKELHEVFANIHLIKALGKEDYEIKKFEESLSEKTDSELKRARVLSISNFSGSILNKVIGGLIALYGGYQVIGGNMTLGSFSAVMIYLAQLLGLAGGIRQFYENFLMNSVSRERLCKILDVKQQMRDAEGAKDYRILGGGIQFSDVSFGYEKGKFVLERMSFSVEPCSKIALVGSSGTGKTTLVTLILRMQTPKEGSIMIDKLEISHMKLNSLKAQFGIALQEPFLWNDTVANNILYGSPQAGKHELIRAAQIAEAHQFILNFPKQYNTVIGEGACRISEGEKQRIALARAIVGKPKILMLDEAMSSLDSETEDRLLENLKREFSDSTIIIISHRLSTVKQMDLVYFLQGPNRIDIATHENFLAKNQKYRELFASQIKENSPSGRLVVGA